MKVKKVNRTKIRNPKSKPVRKVSKKGKKGKESKLSVLKKRKVGKVSNKKRKIMKGGGDISVSGKVIIEEEEGFGEDYVPPVEEEDEEVAADHGDYEIIDYETFDPESKKYKTFKFEKVITNYNEICSYLEEKEEILRPSYRYTGGIKYLRHLFAKEQNHEYKMREVSGGTITVMKPSDIWEIFMKGVKSSPFRDISIPIIGKNNFLYKKNFNIANLRTTERFTFLPINELETLYTSLIYKLYKKSTNALLIQIKMYQLYCFMYSITVIIDSVSELKLDQQPYSESDNILNIKITKYIIILLNNDFFSEDLNNVIQYLYNFIYSFDILSVKIPKEELSPLEDLSEDSNYNKIMDRMYEIIYPTLQRAIKIFKRNKRLSKKPSSNSQNTIELKSKYYIFHIYNGNETLFAMENFNFDNISIIYKKLLRTSFKKFHTKYIRPFIDKIITFSKFYDATRMNPKNYHILFTYLSFLKNRKSSMLDASA